MKTTKIKASAVLALVFASLAMSSVSRAAVSVVFKQDGSDVVATWNGVFNPGTWGWDNEDLQRLAGPDALLWLDFNSYGGFESWVGGTASITSLVASTPSSSTGNFGFWGGEFRFAGVFNNSAPAFSSIDFGNSTDNQIRWENTTLSALGADAFGNTGGSGTLAWTSSAGDQIRYFTAVPEPSSLAISVLGLLGVLSFRKRR